MPDLPKIPSNWNDDHADLVLYEGWFDDGSKQVELVERKKIKFDVPPLPMRRTERNR